MLALVKVHQAAVTATPNGLWTRLYVRGLDPEEAAQAAAREYDPLWYAIDRLARTIRA